MGRQVAAVFALADSLKPEARTVIEALKAQGVRTALITGDHERAAKNVAAALGVDMVRAGILPEQKMEQIVKWQTDGYRVAMVGDGLNDAPALAKAHLGIALQTGTELAIGSAEVALLGGRLTPLVGLITLARQTSRVLVQNYVWAFVFNVVALPLAALGRLAPAWGALAMVASSLAVIGNSLRLKSPRGKQQD